MKKQLIPLFVMLILAACQKESISPDVSETNIELRAQNKRDVCHNGHIINIDINAIPAHQAHGDAVDMDDDGFFDLENVCSSGVDCNDSDPTIYPNATEVCEDGIDNNCDGEVNEGCFFVTRYGNIEGFFFTCPEWNPTDYFVVVYSGDDFSGDECWQGWTVAWYNEYYCGAFPNYMVYWFYENDCPFEQDINLDFCGEVQVTESEFSSAWSTLVNDAEAAGFDYTCSMSGLTSDGSDEISSDPESQNLSTHEELKRPPMSMDDLPEYIRQQILKVKAMHENK